MSQGDASYACGCYSYATDCRTPGGGGFCKKHDTDTAKMTNDAYFKHWQKIRTDNALFSEHGPNALGDKGQGDMNG